MADRSKESCRCHLGMPPFQNLSNVAALAVASMMQPQQQTQAAPPQQNLLNPTFGATGTGEKVFHKILLNRFVKC